MKIIIFTLLTLLSLSVLGQDTVFNFNTTTESFSFAGWPNNTATNGYLTTGVVSGTGTAGTGGVTGGFQQMRTPNGLGLAEADYKIIRLVVENSTNNTDWGIVSYDTGSTNAGQGVRIDYSIPTVAAGSGFTTFDFAIPVNADNTGTIDRLGIRAKQNSSFVWSGEFKIAQIVIINTFDENSFVANADFETSTDWVASGGQVTGGYTTTDPNGGAQSGTLTFTADQTSNQFLDGPIYDLGKTVNPATLECSFSVKTNNTALEVQVLYDLYEADGTTKISGNNTGVYTVTAANTWEPVSFSKVITDEFNQIQFRLKVKTATALDGDVVVFDDITASFSYYETSNSWTGSTDTDWANTANWTNGVIPSSLKNSDVQVSSNNPIISATTGATLNNLAVDSGASLTINSGGSLIVSGTSAGNVTYNRNLATTNWYNISSPVVGQGIADFYTNESPELGSGTGNAQNVAIATYDNTQALATDRYIYYTEGQVDGLDADDTTDTFNAGIGYTVKLQSSQDVSFTGTVRTDNAGIPVTLSQGANNINLLGNPYLAFINSTTFLGAESTNLESTFWIWNGATYDTRTTGTHPNFMIAPAQGFFVEAKTTNAVTFTEANQSHETDNFQKTANSRPEIKLNLSNGSENRKTELFYIAGTTKGFDNGFDGKMFGGASYDFAIYTGLVSNSVGIKYAVQSLPNSDFENMIVPIGVIADAGKELTFSIEENNIPTGVKIYLEDRSANTFNKLSDSKTFKVTLSEALNDVGRFYLHTLSKALSIDDIAILESVSIYKTNASTLKLVGLPNGTSNVKLFNILGKQVMNTSFNANGVKEISLPDLAKGVYIVQLETESSKLNKKIVLE